MIRSLVLAVGLVWGAVTIFGTVHLDPQLLVILTESFLVLAVATMVWGWRRAMEPAAVSKSQMAAVVFKRRAGGIRRRNDEENELIMGDAASNPSSNGKKGGRLLEHMPWWLTFALSLWSDPLIRRTTVTTGASSVTHGGSDNAIWRLVTFKKKLNNLPPFNIFFFPQPPFSVFLHQRDGGLASAADTAQRGRRVHYDFAETTQPVRAAGRTSVAVARCWQQLPRRQRSIAEQLPLDSCTQQLKPVYVVSVYVGRIVGA